MQIDNSYPMYRRRNNGIKVNVRGNILDNRWVVPYNPKLLMMFNCHIKVEVCSSIIYVKYVFKYVYKGHNKQVIHVDPDTEEVIVNEIKRFQDARYVSPPEAIWRIFSFPLSQIHPYVMALQVHLPNKQLVRFRENDIMADIVDRERDKSSMLTAFFERNKTDMNARQYLYKDFPKHYTWNASSHLYTVNGIIHPTFRKAALERGLIEIDDNLSHCLVDASLFQFPNALRRLFATILIYCEPGDVRKLWDEHYDSLSEDYRRDYENVEGVRNMVLTDIAVFLQSMGKNLDDFDLPSLNAAVNLESRGFREVQEEYSIIVQDEDLNGRNSLNSDQKHAFDEIMMHVDNDCPTVFFVDGPGGTGKTFLYRALLANVRSRGLIAIATASSGATANNMPGGRTAHSRFKIPLTLSNNSVCNIKKTKQNCSTASSRKNNHLG
ncbi:uncharacterized protein LOC112517764 [Cynara cardunculus var. scolymus]|uniref:uncharacterized protein LOC112517764 n=1 Tax=Cynara cardunculus var. scolymus TaxID=59895 RepID=UPI000D63066A|nr:uncharacterized protein LOC112517764 [Cynara cardunculus var. scolymus]